MSKRNEQVHLAWRSNWKEVDWLVWCVKTSFIGDEKCVNMTKSHDQNQPMINLVITPSIVPFIFFFFLGDGVVQKVSRLIFYFELKYQENKKMELFRKGWKRTLSVLLHVYRFDRGEIQICHWNFE